MGALITDEMLAAFAVEGATLAEAARAAVARYAGLVDRIAFYRPYRPGEADADWRAAAAIVRAADEGSGVGDARPGSDGI